jgi:hypothetical protein
MTDDAATRILGGAARVLAHIDDGPASLEIVLGLIVSKLDVASAVVFAIPANGAGLALVAKVGLDDSSARALASAVENPAHPIARTSTNAEVRFNVQPTAPGGPALRSHLPLVVTRGGTDRALGVLALAHSELIDSETQPILEASADLLAITLERAGAH